MRMSFVPIAVCTDSALACLIQRISVNLNERSGFQRFGEIWKPPGSRWFLARRENSKTRRKRLKTHTGGSFRAKPSRIWIVTVYFLVQTSTLSTRTIDDFGAENSRSFSNWHVLRNPTLTFLKPTRLL